MAAAAAAAAREALKIPFLKKEAFEKAVSLLSLKAQKTFVEKFQKLKVLKTFKTLLFICLFLKD